MSKGKTSDGYNHDFDYQDAADNAKWELDNKMESGARDSSWARDPRNQTLDDSSRAHSGRSNAPGPSQSSDVDHGPFK